VSKAHESWKICNPRSIVKDFGCHPLALALIDAPTGRTGHDSTSILATMLEKIECIMYFYGSR
jgi:hypothetical protein